MDRVMEEISTNTHSLKLTDRKHLVLTGIKKIISFDNEEFLMESALGNVLLKGEELEIIKLDTHDGNVSIRGRINSFTYLDSKEKNKEDGIIAKLFK